MNMLLLPEGGKDFFITPSPLGERVGVRGSECLPE
jgi:hypothetical protein